MKIFVKMLIFLSVLLSLSFQCAAAEPKKIEEIKILSHPAKSTYYLNEPFEEEGLIVQGIYSDGSAEILEEELYLVSALGLEDGLYKKPGIHNVSVTAREDYLIRAMCNVRVEGAVYSELIIKNPPRRQVYYTGDTSLDLSGIEMALKLSDGSEIFLPSQKLEVDAASFNTDRKGKINLVLSYKGLSAELPVTILPNEAVGYTITSYPKSNYLLGEELDLSALTVARLYLNGAAEELMEDLYEVSSDFDGENEGTYNLIISVKGGETITHKLTVRQEPPLDWKTLRLGYFENKAEVNGGIGQYYDSLILNYIELPVSDNFEFSAAIEAESLEGDFGLMLRDSISGNRLDTLASANLVAMGINNSRLTLLSRSEESKGLLTQTVDENPSDLEYSFNLNKTNGGFAFTFGGDSGITRVIPKEDMTLSGDTMYLGFYTSSAAKIDISDIKLSTSAAVSDPPAPELYETPKKSEIGFLSSPAISDERQNISFVSNVNGTAVISVDDRHIATKKVKALETVTVPGNFAVGQNNTVIVSIFPDAGESSFEPEMGVFNQLTAFKSYEGSLYASPAGSPDAAGGYLDPVDIVTALSHLRPGQQLYLYDGVYKFDEGFQIGYQQSGRQEQPKKVSKAPNSSPVFDFGGGEGFVLDGDYWHISDVRFQNSGGSGFSISGNGNAIQNCEFVGNGAYGLMLREALSYDKTADLWPSNNLIASCVSRDNEDGGFLAALKVGSGNIFRGCAAGKNGGNGFETFMTAEAGGIGAILFENCISYENSGDGFTLGNDFVKAGHILRDCLAAFNTSAGFAANTNPVLTLTDCTAWNNGVNLSMSEFQDNESDQILGFYSLNEEGRPKDEIPETLIDKENFFFDGTASVNKDGKTLSPEVFHSTAYREESLYYFERDSSLVRGPFLKRIEP